MKSYKLQIINILLVFSMVSGILLLATIIKAPQISALSGAQFKAGRIIDDTVFYNSSTMSAAEIQNFLNSKVPSCDTWGKKMYNSTQTRAQYGASRGYPTPYTCLKDYKQSIPAITNSGSDLCTGNISSGTKSAAQIIYDVSKACGINPQTLLVLLQKEQSLVTDEWPWSIQYRSATGYGCPDTAPCDSEYYGYFNQVYQAAKAFKRYAANPANYNYKANRNNYIYYNPDLSRCGGTNVYIENQATASLYIYTPYQPNAAALNNLYGSGDSCSAYGNRNFWRMFNDWFGSTYGSVNVKGITMDQQPFVESSTNARFTLTNTTRYTVDLGRLKVEAKHSDGTTYHFPSVYDVRIGAGKTFTYSQSITIAKEGNYEIFISRYDDNKWHIPPFDEFGVESNGKINRLITKKPTVTSSLSLSKDTNHINSPLNAGFTMTNNSATFPVNIGRMKVEGRHESGKQYDFPSIPDNTVIQPGATYTYSASQSFPWKGKYTFMLMNYRSTHGWSAQFPESETSAVVRSIYVSIN